MRVNLLSLTLLGAIFGLIAGLVSLLIVQGLVSSTDFEPDWVELSAGLLSVKRPYPIENWLLYSWPIISLAAHGIVAALLGLLYNTVARLSPLRIELSD